MSDVRRHGRYGYTPNTCDRGYIRAPACIGTPEIGASTYPKERPLESAGVCAATVRRRNPLLLDPRRILHRRTAPLSR